LHGIADDEDKSTVMVHGAGIQVVVIRVIPSRITACLECGNSSQMQENVDVMCMKFSAQALGVHRLVKVAVIWCL